MDWRMRELIVTKGLPRAFVHTGQYRQESLLAPDALYAHLSKSLRGIFPMMLAAMQWPPPGKCDRGRFDRWDGPDLVFARDVWGRSIELDEIDRAARSALPADNETLERFVAWSMELTGFDDLEDDLDFARSILSRLRLRDVDLARRLDWLLRKLEAKQYRLTPQSVAIARVDAELAELTTILWYTGTFMEGDFPATDFGTMKDDHYRKGLVWRAIGAQPAGYSTKMDRWWKKPGDES